jgi:hypothetical protein
MVSRADPSGCPDDLVILEIETLDQAAIARDAGAVGKSPLDRRESDTTEAIIGGYRKDENCRQLEDSKLFHWSDARCVKARMNKSIVR